MSNYRFRTEGNLLVLQVEVRDENATYAYRQAAVWRDAGVEDIPVFGPFNPPPPYQEEKYPNPLPDYGFTR